MAQAKAEMSNSSDEQSAADFSTDGGTATDVTRASRGNRASAGAKAAPTPVKAVEQVAAGLARVLIVDEALAENLARTILPQLQKVSGDLLRAVEPVLQRYQQDVVHALEEQVQRAFPAIDRSAPHGADRETEEIPGATRSQDEQSAPQAQDNVGAKPDEREHRTDRDSTTSEIGSDEPAGDAARMTTDHTSGGTEMPSKTEQKANDESTGDASEKGQGSNDRPTRGRAQQQNGKGREGGSASRPQNPTYFYDPQGAARAGLLRLATDWKEAGSAYQAMHAYMEVLRRYPQTGAAAAATEGLVDLANRLQKQGKFYAALNIYDKLDAML
jgi:hypothetical protein